MSEPKEIHVSVTSGIVSIGIVTNQSKEDVQNALSLAMKVISENKESIGQMNNQHILIKATKEQLIDDANELTEIIAANLSHLKTPQLVLIALRNYGEQTRSQIREKIENWGKPLTDSFTDHFSRDFLKTGLVREIQKAEDGEPVYSLTEKAKIEAIKTLKELRGKKLDRK